MKNAVAVLLLATTIGKPQDRSPFGIPEGTSIKSLKVVRAYGDKYYVIKPPIANSNFEEYIVLATPKNGVCAIYATSPEYDNTDEVKVTFDRLVRLLNKYGRSHTVKFSSGWPLLDLTARYFPIEWKWALPSNLGSVVVEPLKRGSAYKVEVTYIYRNVAGCSNWEPNQDRSGL